MEEEGGSHIFSMAPCPRAVTPPAFPCSPHPASFPTCFPPPAPVWDLLFPPSFPRQPEPVSVSHQGFISTNPAPSACSCTSSPDGPRNAPHSLRHRPPLPKFPPGTGSWLSALLEGGIYLSFSHLNSPGAGKASPRCGGSHLALFSW